MGILWARMGAIGCVGLSNCWGVAVVPSPLVMSDQVGRHNVFNLHCLQNLGSCERGCQVYEDDIDVPPDPSK